MAKHSSDFLNVLDERGFIHQCSDFAGLDALAAKGEVVAYVGYDCTAPSLHVGHLISIMMLHWLQQTGGKPIALMGGGTTRVGDPSGKDETRRILPIETIEANKDAHQGRVRALPQVRQGPDRCDHARQCRVAGAAQLHRLPARRRPALLGQPHADHGLGASCRLERDQELSFIEFNYMLLQAYDFVELARRYGCNLQMGGSDQWGNIVTGIDLGRRMGTHQLYALTCPLLTTSSGAKMGKTAAGAVWLNEDQLSRLRLLAVLAQHRGRRCAALPEALHHAADGRDRQARGACRAPRSTRPRRCWRPRRRRCCMAARRRKLAARTAQQTFEKGATSEGLPTVEIAASELGGGLGVLAAFVKAGLVKSNGEARRQIQGGGLRVNDAAVTDETAKLTHADVADGVIKLSLGKKRHVLLKVV